ncbi:TetR/AcrR family transcriptional regulator [Planomonospora parontospora]|uniref:TetR/AcrR family transcriptional regulator n=1 Tax=Planomonospora parontospora TaxID=58119 RepID=UPI001987AF3A|nr:TetR/AcrR family transcriptional regulator [Planomonospora parontospora]GGL46761.1 TetR family transcriptional regulator [Planomonospora parontospora subsp. antibiotica]GII19425.1 TetR family transcriptional regulator [Planomonospora parontospora subsp. antibiotica]
MDGESRSARKRREIMEAATQVFLTKGYLGTSMDEVAALAKVSKQTVYKHFADKENLYTQIVLATTDKVEALFTVVTKSLADSDDLEGDLRAMARQFIAFLVQPDRLRLRRLVIAEADRFPELSRTYFERGPDRVHGLLADSLTTLHERGRLRAADPRLAAEQLTWLIISIPLNKVMLCGSQETFTEDQLHHYADEGVRVFLAAYGT